jgi:hypothetical protein
MQIVIAWAEDDQVIVKQGRIDIGERHVFKTVPKPMACMWLNNGNERDVEKARAYAAKSGHVVFCYTEEADPLATARADILKITA